MANACIHGHEKKKTEKNNKKSFFLFLLLHLIWITIRDDLLLDVIGNDGFDHNTIDVEIIRYERLEAVT